MLILLSGKSKSGKTTVAEILRDDHGFQIVSFASLLKNRVASDFNLSSDEIWGDGKDVYCSKIGAKPRDLYTDFGNLYRKYDPDYWAKAAFKVIDKKLSTVDFVVDDCRFMNEVKFGLLRSGHIIRVHRKSADGRKDEDISEKELDNYSFEHVIENSKSKSALRSLIDDLVMDLRRKENSHANA